MSGLPKFAPGPWFAQPDPHSISRDDYVIGIGCVTVEYDLAGFGKLTRSEPEPLNFEDMDETRFSVLWDGGQGMNYDGGWIGWLRREVFGGLDAIRREEVEKLIEKPQ